jgi:dolichyl-phosphate-mannose--protein O-mannosyl transferase
MSNINDGISKSNQLADGARYVFINAFVFFSAFLLRDISDKLWNHSLRTEQMNFGRSIGFQFLLFFIVFMITMFVAMFWKNNGTTIG